MTEDAELLRRYFDEHSEEAFAELVRRHLSLVYFTALRRVNGQSQLAEDASQAVFISLAQSAGRLRGRSTLGGWLYTAAKNAAANALRAEKRRKAREMEAIVMQDSSNSEDGASQWAELRPVIDDAMDRLSAADREAVILRYFQGEPWAHIGAVLRTSEDAARVRVDRALDKLRASLRREGYVSTAATLGAVLSGQAAIAAIPAGLAAAVTGGALAVGGAAGGTALAGAVGLWTFMSTTKMAVGVVALVAAIGIGIALKDNANEQEVPAEAIAAAPLPPSKYGLLAISNTLAPSAPNTNNGNSLQASLSKPGTSWSVAARQDAGKAQDGVLKFRAGPSSLNPEEARLDLRRRNAAAVEAGYRELFLKPRWTAEKQSRLIELRLDWMERKSDLFKKAVRADSVPTTRESAAAVLDVVDDMGEGIYQQMVRDEFGDDVLKEVINFETGRQIRFLIEGFAGKFVPTETPVSASAVPRLEDIVVSHARTPDGLINLSSLDLDAVLQEANTLLHGPQLTTFRERLTEAKARAAQRDAVIAGRVE